MKDDNDDQLKIEEEAKQYIYGENNNSLEKGKDDKIFPNRITVVDNNFDEDESRENSLGLNKIRQTSNSNYNEDINQNINTINNSNPISQRVTRGSNNKIGKSLHIIDVKIILLGDSAVGKTSIIGRYINNTFKENYSCTIQAEKKMKIINEDENTSLRLNIWDTMGQEKYKSVTRQYYHDSDGAIIVFDLTKRETFDNVKNWINDLRSYGSEDTNIIILGNKSDEKNKREISEEEIKQQLNNDYFYLEVSAKTGNNISLAFDKLKKLIMEYLKIKDKKKKEDNLNQRKSHKTKLNDEIIKDEAHKGNKKGNKCC